MLRQELIKKCAKTLQTFKGSYSHLFAAFAIYDSLQFKITSHPKLVSCPWSPEQVIGICLILATRLVKDLQIKPDQLSQVFYNGKRSKTDIIKMTFQALEAIQLGIKYPTPYQLAKQQALNMMKEGVITQQDYQKVCFKMAKLMLNFLINPAPLQRNSTLVYILLKCGLRVLDQDYSRYLTELRRDFIEIGSFVFEIARMLQSNINWQHNLCP